MNLFSMKSKIKNKTPACRQARSKTQAHKFKNFLRFWVCVFYFWFFIFCFGSNAYSFVVFGDNQGNYRVFGDLVSRLKQEKGLAFIVSVGDFTANGELQDYQKARGMISQLNLPFYQVMGNHDGVAGGWRNFLRYFGRFYYSFDYQGDRFIFLNNAFKESFDREQFNWLREELGKGGARHIFVFMHKPIFDPSEIYKDHIMSGREVLQELMRLFKKYKVDYVFAGHIHGYAKAERDGVTYIVTAGAGAPLYLPPEFGGFYHYVRVEVEGGKIKDRVVRIYE